LSQRVSIRPTPRALSSMRASEWRCSYETPRLGVASTDLVGAGRSMLSPCRGKESEEHIGYVISGRMAVRAKDGAEVEVGPGEAFIAAPGHDAWVLGEEPCVALDFIATAAPANRQQRGSNRPEHTRLGQRSGMSLSRSA
jgi:Cupin domain